MAEENAEGSKGKGKSKGAGRRKGPKPPLQPDIPAVEGAPIRAGDEAPGGRGRGKISSGKDAGKPMRVAEIMTEDPVSCVPGTPLERVARMMVENSCGAIPVIRGQEDRVAVGVITDRDVAVRTVAHGKNPLDMVAGDILSGPAVTIGSDDTVEACAALMREHRLRRIVVVDPRGRVVGLVTQAQLVKHLPKEALGETVRDISLPPKEG